MSDVEITVRHDKQLHHIVMQFDKVTQFLVLTTEEAKLLAEALLKNKRLLEGWPQ